MVAAAIAVGTVVGCTRPHAGATGGVAQAPDAAVPASAARPLRVGTSGDYAPFSYRDLDGTLAGFDVAVARAYAADRGRALELAPFRWPELGARLAAGDFDVVMSGVTVRPDRLVAGVMTATVADSEAVLVTSTDHGPRRTIAVNRGGHLEQVARTRFPRARLLTVDDNAALPSLLARGEADAIVTDTHELAAFAARAPQLRLRVAARLSRDRKAYWLPAGAETLAADLDAWLLEHERSGWLPELRARLLASVRTRALPPAEASLVERVRRRLSLMPAVATAKRAAALPIEDPARERAVEHDASARALASGLDPISFVALTRAQIAAAKAIQRATPASAAPLFALADLRHAIDLLDARIALEFAAAAPLTASVDALAAALYDDDAPGLSPTLRRMLARALRGVHQGRVAAPPQLPLVGEPVRR